MSRFKRFIHGVVSSYAVLIANALYSLLSVPLALHYLSTAEFGIWVVGTQVAMYLNFLDVGMSPSLTRLLVDHKDHRADGAYGSMILTGLLVSGVQGILVLGVGLALSFWGAPVFGIPQDLQRQFEGLMAGLAALTTATFFTRVFSQLLQAHQRADLFNYVQIVSLAANAGILWLAFELGAGVFSLLAASVAAWLASIGMAIPCCLLKLWPGRGEWGKPNWRSFREIFAYGSDVFLIAVGTQLINTSQVIIIAQTRGVEAATLWAVMTKPFVLISQLAWRPIGMSLAAFAEMQARGEMQRFWDQYRLLFISANVGTGFLAVIFAFANGPFVEFWTGGKMQWPGVNNWLLALWLILLTQLCCHNSMLMVQKQIGRLKYAYFIEAFVFLSLGLTVGRWGGLSTLIICSIVCTAMFTLAYGTWRIATSPAGSGTAWIWQSQKHLLRLLAVLAPLALGLQFALANLPPLAQFVTGTATLGGIGTFCILRFCLPNQVAIKLTSFLPRGVQTILRKIIPAPAMAD